MVQRVRKKAKGKVISPKIKDGGGFGYLVFQDFCGNFEKLGFFGGNLTTDFTDYTDFEVKNGGKQVGL